MKMPILLFLLLAGVAQWAAASDPVAALTDLEKRYGEDRAAALRLVLARYTDELAALQKLLLEAGDTAGAARVQLERDRIFPALGLPAVSAENADEFAAFEEPAAAPVLPPGNLSATPGDLESILKTLLPPAPSTTAAVTPAGPAKPPVPGTAGAGRRLLRMATAQLSGTYDPVYGYVYWSGGRSASWTLSDLLPGFYKLQLRYMCDDEAGGGTLRARFGEITLETDVPPTGNWKRKRDLVIGPFEIKETRAEVTLTTASVRQGASYLMDLAAVLVLPADAATPP